MITFRRALFLLAMSLGAGACQRHEPNPLGAGDDVPAMGIETTSPALIWVFRTESCLNCDLAVPATMVRVLAHQFEDKLAVVAVAVGEPSDTSIVQNFLKGHRISATVFTASRRRHGRQFGQARLPALYLAHRGVIVDAVDLSDADARISQLRKASYRMRQWLEEAPAAGVENSLLLEQHGSSRDIVVLNGLGATMDCKRRVCSGKGEAVTLSDIRKGAIS